jgi:hypothetical protein
MRKIILILIVLLLCNISYADLNMTSGTNATNLTVFSANSYAISLNSATSVNFVPSGGANQSYWKFPLTTSKIDVSHSALTRPFTISFWTNYTSLPNGWSNIFPDGGCTGFIQSSGGAANIYIGNVAQGYYPLYTLNEWVHQTIVFNSSGTYIRLKNSTGVYYYSGAGTANIPANYFDFGQNTAGGCTGSGGVYGLDEVYFFNRSLTWNESEYLDTRFYPYPVITNSMNDIIVVNESLNFTSDGGQICGFNGTGYTLCGPTYDRTPTFTFSTLGNSLCKLWNLSSNYTTLAGLSVADCGTTGTTAHTCTIPTDLRYGNQTLYISCKSGEYEMNTFNQSNLFNISILNTAPQVTWTSQNPADLDTLNGIGPNGTNITYNIYDSDGLIGSSVILYYKVNDTNNNCISKVNGSTYCDGNGAHNISRSANNHSFILLDNQIYPGIYNANETMMETTYHNVSRTLNANNQRFEINFINSSLKNYTIAEFMMNCTGATGVIAFKNSSGSQIDFATVLSGEAYNHCHRNYSYSCHMAKSLVYNSTSNLVDNAITFTTNFSFEIRRVGGGSCTIYGIVPAVRTDISRYSTNGGVTWSNEGFTADSHIHTYNGNESLRYYACANDTYGLGNCSVERTDFLQLAGLPPSASAIVMPDYVRGGVNITWTQAISPNGYSVNNYSLYLYNYSNNLTNAIFNTTSGALNYYWNSQGNSTDGNYTIRVIACDSLVQCSTGTSNLFEIDNDCSAATKSIYLDGQNNSRDYELGTTATINISSCLVETSCLEVDGTQYSCFSSIDSVIYYQLNNTKLNISDKNLVTTNTSIDIPKYTEALDSSYFNILTNGIINNLNILQDGNSIAFFPGQFNKNQLKVTNFTYSGVEYQALNLSFDSASSKLIYINQSNFGTNPRGRFFNLSITGYALDTGNSFYFDATGINVNTNFVNYGTKYPDKNFSNNTRVYEDFSQYMSRFSYTNNSNNVGFFTAAPSYFSSASEVSINSTRIIVLSSGTSGTETMDYTYIPASSLDYIKTFYEFKFRGISMVDRLEFSDGTNSVTIQEYSGSYCVYWGAFDGTSAAITLTKSSSNTWDYTGTSSGSVNVATLNTPYYLRVRISGSNCESGDIGNYAGLYFLDFSGIRLNRTGEGFTGIEGITGTLHNGNWTSHLINTTPNNVTKATLTWHEFAPTNTSVVGYLSNNNGTNWETVTNAESHLFLTKGNNIKARFQLASISNITSPIVLDYQVQVVESNLDELDLDIGNDGILDYFYLNLNYSTSLNDSTLFEDYIFNNCTGMTYCSIPVNFITTSGGLVGISNLNYTVNVSNIKLNTENISYFNSSTVYFNHTPSGSVNYSFFVYYNGNMNISFKLTPINITHIARVVYSKFNLSYPNGIDFWEIYPRTRVQNNVEPWGQNSTTGIWQFSFTPSHNKGFNIFTRLNQSIDATSCVSRINVTGYNFMNNTQSSLIYNTSEQILFSNITSQALNQSWTYTNINCTNTTKRVIIPYFCFFSLCNNCTQTIDWEDYCDFEE